MKELTLESATELLHSNMKNQNLRRHCYSVGKVLSAYYDYYTGLGINTGHLNKEQWEITGILHDSDYEITAHEENKHTLVLLDRLKDYNVPEEMLNVFRTHNNKITGLREPQTLLEWTLECCDELTGFIVAVALVMPEKKLENVTLERILSKFKQKEFARAVDRNQITQCKEKLNTEPDTFVKIALNAMQESHELLGL